MCQHFNGRTIGQKLQHKTFQFFYIFVVTYSHLLISTISVIQSNNSTVTLAAEGSHWMLFPKCRKQINVVWGSGSSLLHVSERTLLLFPLCGDTTDVNVRNCSLFVSSSMWCMYFLYFFYNGSFSVHSLYLFFKPNWKQKWMSLCFYTWLYFLNLQHFFS